MKRWLTAGALTVAILSLAWGAQAQTNADSNPANPLITDKGRFRPLVLIAPSTQETAYRHLKQRINDTQAQFRAREMLLYTVVGSEGTRHGQPMTRYETAALLDALDVDPRQGVTTILIGKDGQESSAARRGRHPADLRHHRPHADAARRR